MFAALQVFLLPAIRHPGPNRRTRAEKPGAIPRGGAEHVEAQCKPDGKRGQGPPSGGRGNTAGSSE
jgi:hypothetical protein